jgi:hypothetical protein
LKGKINVKKCYICSRTLVLEGENQNVSYLDSEICLNCELTLENIQNKNKNKRKKKNGKKM